MSISADELPREGLDTQQFIDNVTQRVGAKNILDVIMSNPLRIGKQFGAKPPAYHPSHAELNMIKPRMPVPPRPNPQSPYQPQPIQPPQETASPNTPPRTDDLPDTPRGLHTPKAKMMPGADTEPGKPVSTNDMEAFNKMLMERRMHQVQHPLPSACGAPLPQYGNPSVVPSYSNAIQPKPVFFKDGLGNEYKTVEDRLYVLGWQDANIKIRLINEANGKEVATNGKKFQIYGWHLVQKMDESEATVSDDVSKIENEIGNDEDVNKDDLPKTEASNTLHPLSIPVIASDINNVTSTSTETKESTVAQDNISTEETKVDDRIDDKSTQSVEKAKETTVSETVASEDISESSNITPKRRKPGKRRLI